MTTVPVLFRFITRYERFERISDRRDSPLVPAGS
jgi:hypothetical protein